MTTTSRRKTGTRTTRTTTGTRTKKKTTTTRTTSIATGSEPSYPSHLERTWQSADGTQVLIRALRPADLDLEVRFIAALSPETLYQRLQYSAREVNTRDAERLLDVDYHDTMAIGALVPAGQPERIIGVSRYARPPGTDHAECAIVVADEWQGRGIGTELMRSLSAAARANGVRVLEGWSLADNVRIQGWARRFGFDVRTEPNTGGTVKVTVDLASLPA